jgi:hypothetical protein
MMARYIHDYGRGDSKCVEALAQKVDADQGVELAFS